jgi:4-hydroxy-2-oxoheptanedioate aldolase
MSLATRLRARERIVGYWVSLDSPPSTERLARLGYDYIALDGQHGLIGYDGLLHGLTAIHAGGGTGIVRVEANDITPIGRALDAGADGVIVPLVDNAEQAAAAVAAARYPPAGARSFGPTRAGLRIGPVPAESNEHTFVCVMIETGPGLEAIDEICATPGLDGVYIGPADLMIGIGGSRPGDPDFLEPWEAAIARIREAAADAGIAAGIHTNDGATAAQRLAEGFTFATVASDLAHLEAAAAAHLAAARGA